MAFYAALGVTVEQLLTGEDHTPLSTTDRPESVSRVLHLAWDRRSSVESEADMAPENSTSLWASVRECPLTRPYAIDNDSQRSSQAPYPN